METQPATDWARPWWASEAKLKLFHHKRGKELEDIPDQHTAPPFPCLKYHIRQTQGEQKP